ncbi:hypothetical protein I8J29_30605 [Paenibacillus sp. MWE-103]|uniref:Lipoprotein n=1 Tax=Paenibacillus artemisiicola TaxID=1172618 RepID=A0ABS3WJN4_9BACL|nr:hypothetical protein [Paenibacillus artemisiicola]MBO7748535.1 hypothetical protein [Paenibacillus artemisiicola]
MRKFLLAASAMTMLTTAGCSGGPYADRETYAAVGRVDAVAKTGAIVDGVRSEWLVTLCDVQQGLISDPGEASASMSLSITGNSRIYELRDGKRVEADADAIRQGRTAQVRWRFANDHLTEIAMMTLSGEETIPCDGS